MTASPPPGIVDPTPPVDDTPAETVRNRGATNDPGSALLLTGGLLASRERSLVDALRKLVPPLLHSRHGWLDIKIKAVVAESLLAWRKVLGKKIDGLELESRLDREAGRSDYDAPTLTETVLAGLIESEGLRVECKSLAEVFTGGREFSKALDRATSVWISSTFLHDLSELEPVLRKVRGSGRRIVLGGALTGSLKAEWPGHPDVDLVVVGYGEYAVPCVAKWQIDGFDRLEPPVGGRVETRRHGRFLFAGTPRGQSLDDLPRPDWSATIRRSGKVFPRISYESVRGCPYRCAFCNYPYLFDDNRFRYRGADAILADWTHYARDLGVRRIECLDSLFTMPPKRLLALCEGLERADLGLAWSCYARADDLCDDDLVASMVRAGATHVQIGVESGDQGQLDRMSKRCTVDKIQRALANCRREGLATIASLIVGYPGETEATLENTFRVLAETPPDFHFLATFSVRVPGVPVLSETSRDLHGLRVLPNRWAMAPYWRHRTMGCDEVGSRVRDLEWRLMSESVSLNAALFHPWTDGYRTGMRERWLGYQGLVIDRMESRRRLFDLLHAWIDRRLSTDLARCLPALPGAPGASPMAPCIFPSVGAERATRGGRMPVRTASGATPDETVESILLRKQGDFLRAIELYGTVPLYRRTGLAVSVANLSLLVWLVLRGSDGWSGFLPESAAFVSAILVADFVNGVVHLVMDRATGYRSAIGPFVANFHLHHRIPTYRRRNLFAVWFLESRSKFWLVGYLAVVAWALPSAMGWSPAWAHFLVLVGVLSTWAEVSHYMCHTTRYPIQGFLERIGLALSRSRHSRHHAEDNVDYAFLNGWTNPVLNPLARLVSGGYKSTTDLHSATYKAAERS